MTWPDMEAVAGIPCFNTERFRTILFSERMMSCALATSGGMIRLEKVVK
jgi:hypothetical protein